MRKQNKKNIKIEHKLFRHCLWPTISITPIKCLKFRANQKSYLQSPLKQFDVTKHGNYHKHTSICISKFHQPRIPPKNSNVAHKWCFVSNTQRNEIRTIQMKCETYVASFCTTFLSVFVQIEASISLK